MPKVISGFVNQIINGDAIEVLKQIPDESVDMILTDIPYGAINRDNNGLRNLHKGDADTFTMDMNTLVEEMIRVTNGSGYIFCGWEQVSNIILIIKKLNISFRVIIWEKTNPSPMNGKNIWLSGIERAVYFKKKNATYNQHCKNVVVRFPCGSGKRHPTEKPVKLFEHFINISSNQGDIVLDPFIGSGTTAVAAKKLGRNYIGIDISEKYCELAEARIKKEAFDKLL